MTRNRSRSFSSRRDSRELSTEKITFSIDDDTFTAKPERSGATILQVASKLTASGGGFESASEVVPFILSSTIDEDRPRLSDRLNDDDNPIDIEVLIDITAFLLEEYTNRPTKG